MAWDLVRQAALSSFVSVDEVRKVKLEATQRLLGDTISLSERAWQEPGKLPGWTRAHIATHLARNADAFVRSIDSVLGGRRGLMYDSDEDRDLAIERGSERGALELQIDLDTSAGNLSERFDVLETIPGDLSVEFSSGSFLRADLLPLARLYEVIIHHVDLDCGFEVSQVNPVTARWLLEWIVLSYKVPRGMAVRLLSSSGFTAVLGAGNAETVISGPDAVLLGWLSGRLNADEALDLPAQPPLA
ncbi:maleylpyruvate isomerase family mycothiol-dependent enzyme [Propionimicrobium sp. PCR01-08-3]|uniref:maleylpyruvate isomerase family mycothiol-dependent enzyme n=1 Tax=Propionimicrobium sp. PCR01-08-3 TaxID=3052086 RepID=UPI00255CA2EC|nr:maleylpyruvate isomerase family mycothiol-dependent enzyme [Propionimicrobium sp. PCR01-08-3]WIY81625.1 maleylpyruvate isomerase family mycothiol-dependent enzyme [Propionimicrobium sp. PCR01-08-3]